MFFSVSTFFFWFIFYFFLTEIVFSIPFRKLTKTAIKRYSATCICFQFDKLCSLFITFVDTQETFQGSLNVVVRAIWHLHVEQCQINVEITLRMSTLKFTMLNNVKSTLSLSTLILATLDNVETMLLFST